MEKEEEKTLIQVSVGIREELRKLGSKGETYNDVIRRILREWREQRNVDM